MQGSRASSQDRPRGVFSRTGKFKSEVISQLWFFQVLQNYAKQHPVKLNLPETLIQGFGIRKPALLRTNSQGLVTSRDGLTTPDIISLLLGFSTQTRAGMPCAVVKQESNNRDSCMPLLSLKAGQVAWNRMLALMQPIVIQKFVYNGSPCAFVLRVRFQPTLSYWAFDIIQNASAIDGAVDGDSMAELSNFLSQSPQRHSAVSVSDRFCVRSSALHSCEFCPIAPVESVKAQVEVIKQVLERGYLSQHDLSVLELETDFLQHSDCKWYFISLHSYKTEVFKKSMDRTGVNRMVNRLTAAESQDEIKSCSVLIEKPAGQHNKAQCADLALSQRLLVSEIMKDLGARKA